MQNKWSYILHAFKEGLPHYCGLSAIHLQASLIGDMQCWA